MHIQHLQWEVVQILVDGTHPGCVEVRSRYSPFCEFDGQSAMLFHRNKWRIYARANLAQRGGRAVQTCCSNTSVCNDFAPFEEVYIEGHKNKQHDVYFLHVYNIPETDEILGIAPVCYSDKDGDWGGIFAFVSSNGVNFKRLKTLHLCPVDKKRTRDVPAHGIQWVSPTTFKWILYEGARKNGDTVKTSLSTTPPLQWVTDTIE